MDSQKNAIKLKDSNLVNKVSLQCEKCGGSLMVDGDKCILACPYCGAKELIIESDAVTIEKMRAEAYKEVELEKIKSYNRQKQIEEEQIRKHDEEVYVENFKKSKVSKFLIINFWISVFFAYFNFSTSCISAGILSTIQSICFGVSWCMGMQIIKEKRRYIYILIALIGVVLTMPMLKCWISTDSEEQIYNTEDVKVIDWNIIFLRSVIPEPNSKKMDIHSNTEEELWIDVIDTTQEEYYKYIIACKENGYTIDINETSNGFEASNKWGYHVDLGYYSDDEMSIQVEAPTKDVDIE